MPRKDNKSDNSAEPAGPQKGEFMAPPEFNDADERATPASDCQTTYSGDLLVFAILGRARV
jgi:hypothetical protein